MQGLLCPLAVFWYCVVKCMLPLSLPFEQGSKHDTFMHSQDVWFLSKCQFCVGAKREVSTTTLLMAHADVAVFITHRQRLRRCQYFDRSGDVSKPRYFLIFVITSLRASSDSFFCKSSHQCVGIANSQFQKRQLAWYNHG